MVTVDKDISGKILVKFQYDPLLVQKVKGYLYYNRDFLNFTGKPTSDITDNDIKNYLVYLSEEKQSATSTLNHYNKKL